ncbi:DUF4365 domain-containing protein [Streptomyces drozdowiczii]|uniref:DUF4365 domain-containing protein n=1 Tax=Streptomyces drozdowiczii TaxID=202862 RepID=UPI0031EB6B34
MPGEGLLSLPSRPPLRGSPKRITDLMESFQEGYLRAVCASAGCVIARPEIDEGIDVSVTHRADSHLATDRVARLEIQLKATTASDFGSDFVKVRLGQERYNYYAVSNPSVHKIVVGLAMPADQDQWIVSSHNALSVSSIRPDLRPATAPPE